MAMTTVLPNYFFSILTGTEYAGTKWSKPEPPPAIGQSILITMNGLGPAKVIGYEVCGGWLGLWCTLDNPPDWWTKQNERNGRKHEALVFGAEIKLNSETKG